MASDMRVPALPADLDLPAKFSGWRPMQRSAIQSILDCKDRFIIQAQPTGSGKSLTYVAAALMLPGRSIILTSTKALQDQLVRDFGRSIGLVDIRGQNGYRCMRATGLSCNEGPCHSGMKCHLKERGCLYYDQVRLARMANIVVTNYYYWMTMLKFAREDGGGLGTFRNLIMDEAHDAPSSLMDFKTLEVDSKRLHEVAKIEVPQFGQDQKQWQRWAALTGVTVRQKVEGMKGKVAGGHFGPTMLRDLSFLSRLERTLNTIADLSGTSWFYCRDEKTLRVGIAHSARGWAEEPLFGLTPRVILMSATVRPKTADMLGLIPDQYTFEDYPSTFDRDRCPVYWLPTLRMNKNTSEDELLRIWLPQIDRIVASRSDRKGIIHTHSYERMNLIRNRSRHKGIMYSNNRFNVKQIVADFHAAMPPAILVSPIMTTGWDFPMEACEYQVIGKLPFPSLGDGLLAERCRRDRGLMSYLTMQTLVQACGRGMRSENDRCETFIVDDSIDWWIRRNGELAPIWFMQSYSRIRTIPPAPEKLGQQVLDL